MMFVDVSDVTYRYLPLTTTQQKREYVQSVDDSGNVTKNCQEDVDEEVSTATTLEDVS
jgi:hypothetical protein